MACRANLIISRVKEQLVSRANRTRANGHRSNGIRANILVLWNDDANLKTEG